MKNDQYPSERSSKKSEQKKEYRLNTRENGSSNMKIWIGLGVFLLVCVIIVISPMKQHIKNTYLTEKDKAYDEFYNKAFDYAENQNHVSNHVILSVEGAREVSRLEVLTVNSSEFVIKNADEEDKTTSWLEVQGRGVFTIDLSFGEFIVDNSRHYVLVRVPRPMLTELKILETGKEFFKSGRIITNGSVVEGVELSQAQHKEGYLKLQDSMQQSRNFYEASKDAAIRVIESLVREWNPDVPDLQIDIEFMEDF